jgi:hypothetical protein
VGQDPRERVISKESLMFRSMQLTRLAAAALVSLAIAACAGQKEPAQKAIADLDGALTKVAEMGEKYMPDEYAAVESQIAELRKSFEGGDFGAVVAAAPKAAAAIRKLQADAIIAKAEHAKQMNAEWVEVAKSMPDTITSVDKQISRMSAGRLPKGMDRDTFKQTVATFDEAKKSWAAAAEAGNAGKYEEAVMQSRQVKSVVDATMQALGMSAG